MKVFIGPYPTDPEKDQEISVNIDPWDTWSMDTTLAKIILPMLRQLKEQKQGAPGCMPSFAQTSNSPQFSFDFYSDGDDDAWTKGQEEWLAVLDSMIWSFEQICTDWEFQFHSGETDFIRVPRENGLIELVPGPNHTAVFDAKGYEAHLQQIKKGFSLFGNHYLDLWD